MTTSSTQDRGIPFSLAVMVLCAGLIAVLSIGLGRGPDAPARGVSLTVEVPAGGLALAVLTAIPVATEASRVRSGATGVSECGGIGI